MGTDKRRIIRDWALFHGFEDDCKYPLISPSDVVLDDLEYRLSLLEQDIPGDDKCYEIDKLARKRWDTIPYFKGKERRLRRP